MAARRATVFQLALGLVLIVVGVLLLVMRALAFDPSVWLREVLSAAPWAVVWPFFVIALGLVLVGIGLLDEALAFTLIPGTMTTIVGLILLVDNAFGTWATWSYTWALVVPFGVGVGLLLWGARTSNAGLRRAGRVNIMIGLVLFAVFGILMEAVFGVGALAAFGLQRYVLPVLLILIGLALMLWPRRRRPAETGGEQAPTSPAERPAGQGEPPGSSG